MRIGGAALILSRGHLIISSEAMNEPRPIYLDHHATTPCDPRVVDAMLPYLAEEFGNAASRTHAYGGRAEEAVEAARAAVARAIGADAREIVFTSGATEANNLAILGVVRAVQARAGGLRGGHVVTCRTEHSSVLDPCQALEREGVRITRLDVASDGHLDPERVRGALEPDTWLVSIMVANNEIGVIHDLLAIGALATSCTAPRASAPCTCNVGARPSGSSLCSTAAGTSGGCAAGRCPWPCAWRWVAPSRSRPGRWRPRPSACPTCGSGAG